MTNDHVCDRCGKDASGPNSPVVMLCETCAKGLIDCTCTYTVKSVTRDAKCPIHGDPLAGTPLPIPPMRPSLARMLRSMYVFELRVPSDRSQMLEFVGWLSAEIPELRGVEVPLLIDALDRFLALSEPKP